MTEDTDNFTRLTWGDLKEWAGAKTLSRGRPYQQEGRVRDLARLPDGDHLRENPAEKPYKTSALSPAIPASARRSLPRRSPSSTSSV